jgi:hypothetical protein
MGLRDDASQVRWRKSSRSTPTGSDCVEVAVLGDAIAVRDSKDPDGPMLLLGRTAWREVARSVMKDELDH